MVPNASGKEKYKISLPTAVRGQFENSVVHREDWHTMLKQFDELLPVRMQVLWGNHSIVQIIMIWFKILVPPLVYVALRFGGTAAAMTTAVVPATPPETSVPMPDEWLREPASVDDLAAEYEIEFKIPGKQAGSSIFLVKAVNRDGNAIGVGQSQKFKAFVVRALSHAAQPLSPDMVSLLDLSLLTLSGGPLCPHPAWCGLAHWSWTLLLHQAREGCKVAEGAGGRRLFSALGLQREFSVSVCAPVELGPAE